MGKVCGDLYNAEVGQQPAVTRPQPEDVRSVMRSSAVLGPRRFIQRELQRLHITYLSSMYMRDSYFTYISHCLRVKLRLRSLV